MLTHKTSKKLWTGLLASAKCRSKNRGASAAYVEIALVLLCIAAIVLVWVNSP